MKKLIIAVIGILLLVGLYGIAYARERGTVTQTVRLFAHQWDVRPKFNFRCKVRPGEPVAVHNRVDWNGERLIHLRASRCDGWTYARNFQAS